MKYFWPLVLVLFVLGGCQTLMKERPAEGETPVEKVKKGIPEEEKKIKKKNIIEKPAE